MKSDPHIYQVLSSILGSLYVLTCSHVAKTLLGRCSCYLHFMAGETNVPRGKGVLAPGRTAPSLLAAGRGGQDKGVFGGIGSSRAKPCWLTSGWATDSVKGGAQGRHRPGITCPSVP